MSLWQIVINDVMSSRYMSQSTKAREEDTGVDDEVDKESHPSVYDIVKPVVIHMMECNISLMNIKELLEKVLINFEIRDSSETTELLDKCNLLFTVGRESIRGAAGDMVGSSVDAGREENLLLVRRLLHSTQEYDQIVQGSTPKFTDSPMNSARVTSRSFDFSTAAALGSPFPPPPLSLRLGPQWSTIDNDPMIVTDEEGEGEYIQSQSLQDRDSLYLTDTDATPPPPSPFPDMRVEFSFAGQPRHESSLGSTHLKQLTSMHSACVTTVDLAQSRYDYVLQTESSVQRDLSNGVQGGVATPLLVPSHHIISGDAEGHVYVTNWSSASSRTSLLGQQRHPGPVLAVRGLPGDHIASACSNGELRVWNLVPGGGGRSHRQADAMSSRRRASAPSRKSAVTVHKPFSSSARGGGGGISGVMLAASHEEMAAANVWKGDMDEEELSESISDGSSWLLAVGGTRGGLKVYAGDTGQAHLAGGREAFSVQSPDRSGVSCMHLASNGGGGLGGGKFLSGQLPGSNSNGGGSSSSGSSAVQSFNNLLKYSVHSRIQALLSTPAPPDPSLSCSSGLLFAGSSKGVLSVFDLSSLSSSSAHEPCVFQSPQESSHTALVSGVVPVPSSGGKHLLSGGYDRLVKFWDVRVSGRDSCCLDMEGAGGAVTHVSVDSSNPHRALAVSSDGVVRLWDTRFIQQYRSGEPYMAFHAGHTDRICDVMQVEGLLLTASRDGSILSWDLSTGRCIQTFNTSSAVQGSTSKAPHAVSGGHASLACTHLLSTRLPLSRSSASLTVGGRSGGDSSSALNVLVQGESAGLGCRRREESRTVAMLVTGDYGGTVKVWRGSAGSNSSSSQDD